MFADDGSVSRYSYCDPSVFVFHPPRTYANENADLQRGRKQLVATLGNAQYRLESNENLDSVPVLTIENVCPQGPFDYLLAEATDVAMFEKARAELQREQLERTDNRKIANRANLDRSKPDQRTNCILFTYN